MMVQCNPHLNLASGCCFALTISLNTMWHLPVCVACLGQPHSFSLSGLRAEEEEEQEVRLELEEREREARRAEEQLNSWQQTLGKQQLDVEGSEKGTAHFLAYSPSNHAHHSNEL